MLYGLVLVVHLFVCLVLIAVILLQAGRGGGLADIFSGAGQSIFGTRGAQVLTRATTVCAVIFMLTSLGLTVMSVQRGKSLLGRSAVPQVQPAAPSPEASQPTPATSQEPSTPKEQPSPSQGG